MITFALAFGRRKWVVNVIALVVTYGNHIISHESNDEDKLRASQMQTNGVRLQQTRLRLF